MMDTLVVSNILDPIHDGLPRDVWDHPASPEPKLKHQHSRWIRATVERVLAEAGYTHVHEWLSLVLTGSLTTYQYDEHSDCDVSLFVDSEVFPEWSRAEMIGLMVKACDGLLLPGTPYQLQCFVVAQGISKDDLYQPGLRSGWDIDHHRWIEPPDHTRVHDVEREMNASYAYALEQADKMERLLRYEPDKAIMFWHQIHKRRHRDQVAGKGDYSDSNIVYKFLANRGLFPQISEVSGEYIAKTALFGIGGPKEEDFSDYRDPDNVPFTRYHDWGTNRSLAVGHSANQTHQLGTAFANDEVTPERYEELSGQIADGLAQHDIPADHLPVHENGRTFFRPDSIYVHSGKDLTKKGWNGSMKDAAGHVGFRTVQHAADWIDRYKQGEREIYEVHNPGPMMSLGHPYNSGRWYSTGKNRVAPENIRKVEPWELLPEGATDAPSDNWSFSSNGGRHESEALEGFQVVPGAVAGSTNGSSHREQRWQAS